MGWDGFADGLGCTWDMGISWEVRYELGLVLERIVGAVTLRVAAVVCT